MTHKLALPLVTTTPHQREDVSAHNRFNMHRCPTRWVFSGTGHDQIPLPLDYHGLTQQSSYALIITPGEESGFQLCPDDTRGRVWRSPVQYADPAFTIARAMQAFIQEIVWDSISFDSLTTLVVIRAHVQHS
ncbi:hypothetical protein TNCV_1493171, partial [Trichonephila clavipes]